uniref:FBA_2 domain-containing protein n=1 Tax=Caenorhabditis tropicalis TaxID=1561998 RepID=A0A1I7UQY7_9PELO
MLDMLAVVEEAIRIFKVPFIDVTLTGTGETLAFFYWAVRRPYRVRNMKLRCFNRIHAENFFDLFIGRCEHLILQFEFERPFKLSREVRWPSKVSLDLHRNHFNLSKLINSPELCFINVHVTDKQLNAFIRSWQSGKRNQRLRRVYFQQWAVLNDVLSRIQVNHKDPLKVKRVFTLNNVTWSIDGGIDIAGPNGKTATIKWEPFREEGMPAETDEEAFRRIFRDYKFTRVTGSLGKLYVSSFTIFVW